MAESNWDPAEEGENELITFEINFGHKQIQLGLKVAQMRNFRWDRNQNSSHCNKNDEA